MKRFNLKLILLACTAIAATAQLSSCGKDDQGPVPVPSIAGFTPVAGLSGTIVTISGAGFGTTPEKNQVKFNGTVATVTAASQTEITTTVPPNATSGPITVTVEGNTATSLGSFDVSSAPIISSFDPYTARVGDEVTITGANFDPAKENNVVRFNNSLATIASASATQLVVTVPPGATSGKIKVITKGVEALSDSDFVVLGNPTITSFTPITAQVGTQIAITGTNFGNSLAGIVVKFNGTTAPLESLVNNTLTVTVPAGATTGKITVTVGGITVTSASDFTVFQSISSFAPASGKPGAIIAINGANFSTVATNNFVTFGDEAATVTQATSTQLLVAVPVLAHTDRIHVTIGAVTVTSASDFVVTDIVEDMNNVQSPIITNASVAFVIGTKAYIGASGQLQTQANYKGFFEFNSQNNQWTQKADFEGAARNGAIGFAVGLKGYVATGFIAGAYQKDCWEFDPSNNDWIRKKDFEGESRAGAAAFTLGSKGYVGLGQIANQTVAKDLWSYDPVTDDWTRLQDLPGAISSHGCSFAIGTTGYVGGGSTNDFWKYDGVSGWMKAEDMPDTGLAAFSVKSKGYLNTWGASLGKLWKYDPITGHWTAAAGGRAVGFYSLGFAIGNSGYLALQSNSTKFRRYTPED